MERAEQNLGVSGDENAELRASVKALEQAQLDLAYILCPDVRSC